MLTFLRWLLQPAAAWLPTATRSDVLWLALSLGGLPITLWNLLNARAADRWRRVAAPDDWALREVAAAHVAKAVAFVAIDVLCVVIGLAAVFNWGAFPALFVLGLLTLRLLLPAIALRDMRLRRRVFFLGRLNPPRGVRGQWRSKKKP